MTRRADLIEAIRVASFEAPKAASHTEWARRINAALDVYDAAVDEPTFTFEAMSDPFSLIVNNAFSVHDFDSDPDCEGGLGWGAYVVGRDWLVGFPTKEAAARAGWDAIMSPTP